MEGFFFILEINFLYASFYELRIEVCIVVSGLKLIQMFYNLCYSETQFDRTHIDSERNQRISNIQLNQPQDEVNRMVCATTRFVLFPFWDVDFVYHHARWCRCKKRARECRLVSLIPQRGSLIRSQLNQNGERISCFLCRRNLRVLV